MRKRGWGEVDFVYVTGDAYVDHPSFGAAIISRVLEAAGYKVAVLSQPQWTNPEAFMEFGKPRLGFLITSGNIDSMVNHYTVAKRKRRNDAYSPGGKMGLRPDRAVIVYSQLAKQAYPHVPIIIGGIEASLRRLAHYDYWANKLRRSVLLDAHADLLLYGMGERTIVEMADSLNAGIPIDMLTYLDGTVCKTKDLNNFQEYIILPSYEKIKKDKVQYAESFMQQYRNTDYYTAKTLVEPYGDSWYIVQNKPPKPLTQAELDRIYSLPYMRRYHPKYEEEGGIPAIQEVKFSLISSRGCFGSCNFCALTFHQGRIIQARSHPSILAEAEKLIWDKDFKGYIHDVGGPTANFRHAACEKQEIKGSCQHKKCLFPTPCKNLKIEHEDYRSLLKSLRHLPNVKKVFVRSGIRYDYVMADKDDRFFKDLCEHHVSGQLKVAPEHVSQKVLEKMGKPNPSVYNAFVKKFYQINKKIEKEQYLVPYFMSSHPGSNLEAAVELAEYIRDMGVIPEQVQDFYPTPGTLSTCMYYTEMDPETKEPIYVAKNPHEKAMQRALIQYKNPKNYHLVCEALQKANRSDLIGFDKHALIRPRNQQKSIQKKDKKIVRKKKKTIRNVHKKKK